MPATKRKSDGPIEVAAKRTKTTPDSTTYSEAELRRMSKEELVSHALHLQSQLATSLAPKVVSEEEVAEKATKARHMLVKGIEKQMKVGNPIIAANELRLTFAKWTSSCKTGSARFTYEGSIHSRAVFEKALGLPSTHTKKMFKMSVVDFERHVGSPEGKARYNHLSITGNDVNVRWSPDENTFKVSGTYGI